MKRGRYVIGALLALAWVAPLRAQEPGRVRGRVVDDASKQPLAAATVTIGTRATQTGADGHFVLTMPAGTDSLRVRMLGYAPVVQAVTVEAGQTVVVPDIGMTQQAVGLSEIVVVGYGQQRAGDITGAVTQLKVEDFNPGRIISPEQLVESKVAGVQVVDNNEPGGGISIRVRGATSVSSSSDPLYVIDGMPVSSGTNLNGISGGHDVLNYLNPNDIESITVLKDASAAAIYGTNAATGVVIITTKSGQGAPRVEYSGSMTSSSITRVPSMLNAAQFRAAVIQYDSAAGFSQLGTANTNWFDLVKRNGWGQEHNLVVSGSGVTSNYRLSFGYMNQEGVIKNSSTERISLGFNYDQHLFGDRLDVKANLRGARTVDEVLPGGVLSNAAQMGPTQPVYDATSATGYYNWPNNSLQSADNPLEILNTSESRGTTFHSVGNLQTDYSLPFLSALHWNTNLGYEISSITATQFTPSNIHPETKSGELGRLFSATPTNANTVFETYLDYAAPLNIVPGRIDVTGGYSYGYTYSDYPNVTLTGLSTNLLGINGDPQATNVSNSNFITETKQISFFGRVNYNLNDRYLVAASVRRDGSSKFSPDNAWGNFPALSAAWRISQEPFLRSFTPLSDLKLRASWAKDGNQGFGAYLYSTSFLQSNPQAQVAFGTTYIPTIRPSAVDPNITWEQTSSWDIGLDYGFLNQRITGAIDYYVKNTDHLINFVPIDPATNLSNYITTNVGSMRNKGLELSLSARILQGGRSKLGWTADFTAANNSNTITQVTPWGGAGAYIFTGGISGGVGSTIQILKAGLPNNSFWVCRQYYDPKTGKPVEGTFYSNVQNAAGDSIFTETPGNSCDSRGLHAEHSPAPTWILGHTSNFTYGNFDLSFTLRAWLGNYVYNNVASDEGFAAQLQRGSPYNLNTSFLKTGFLSAQYLSDLYLEDGSFLRMDNISLGYTFRYQGRQMRVYATVQNVFTITGYSGVDPTAGINGIDNNIYPRSRIVTGGLSVRL
ncbi:MAG TPA: SusC/RagA family TonB-linked outer membrane protein [Gemmatimonadales bacterium]|nr:SusC/RagA family TonB-linked outer membrane protein [Gemmatimonadales bacterium]